MTDAPKGFIKLARKAFDEHHGDAFWLEPRVFSKWEAWVDVLQMAAWKAHPRKIGSEVIELARGEFVASLRYLATRWKWTVKRVRTWLALGVKGARLRAQREAQAGTVYLVVNYERYQSVGSSEGTAEGTASGIGGAQEGHKGEEGKAGKAKNSLSYDSLFEEAWAAYPKRPGNNKHDAWSQWLKRVAEGTDPLDLLEATRRYATWVQSQPSDESRRWVLMARTFYGPARRFADDWSVTTEPAGPIVDEFGVLTAYGERITRPVRVA